MCEYYYKKSKKQPITIMNVPQPSTESRLSPIRRLPTYLKASQTRKGKCHIMVVVCIMF